MTRFLNNIVAMKTLRTVREVIDALGGREADCDLTGSKERAVILWRCKGFIPSKMYLLITGALLEIGCVADKSVFGFAEPPSKSPARKRARDEKRA